MQSFLSSWTELVLIGMFFVVFYFFCIEKLSFIINKPLVFLGTISYSLYLIHQVVGFIVIRELEALGLESHLSVIGALFLVISIAYLMNIVIEKSVMKAIREKYSNWKEVRSVRLLD